MSMELHVVGRNVTHEACADADADADADAGYAASLRTDCDSAGKSACW
jgi:hypothetical protein